MAPRKKRRSKLDPYLSQVGKVPDREIAERAGVSPDAVRMFRQRHKIPSYRTYLKSQGPTPRPAPAPPSAKPLKKAAGGQRAFLLTLKSAKKESEWVILASDIIDAASQAEASGQGEVIALRYLGEVLS
ncbi:MAG: hypothetical protein VXW32_00345 [Myxococcota bacterium]|jgi:hypothetical protein|nr:hypothetical protein [Myxococcota bacterium]